MQATGKKFTGKISRFTDSFDRSTRSMQVEIDVPNPDYKIDPGMYANVTLQTQNKADALTIPVQALQDQRRRPCVWWSTPMIASIPYKCRPAFEAPNLVEISAGLKPGDRVILGNGSSYQGGRKGQPETGRDRQTRNGGTE